MDPIKQESLQSEMPYHRVFGTAMRLRESLLVPLATIFVALLLTYSVLLIAKTLVPDVVSAEPSWRFEIGTIAFLILVGAGVSSPIYRFLMGSMEGRLRSALDRRYGVDLSGAAYVGIAPYKDSGITDWDVGFLVVAPDVIRFYGDRISIQWMPAHIYEIKFRSAWVTRRNDPQIRIVWKEFSPLEYFTSNVRLRSPLSIWARSRNTKELCRRISEWHASTPVSVSGEAVHPAISQDSPLDGQPARRFPSIRSVVTGLFATVLVSGMLVATAYLYAWMMSILGGHPSSLLCVLLVLFYVLRAVLEARASGGTLVLPP